MGMSGPSAALPSNPIRFDHNPDGSYVIRADQAKYEELMSNPGLQRHIIKANFVWDMPDLKNTEGSRQVVAAVLNDWQVSGVFTAGSGTPYDISYSYQSNGANVNLTGSPDY